MCSWPWKSMRGGDPSSFSKGSGSVFGVQARPSCYLKDDISSPPPPSSSVNKFFSYILKTLKFPITRFLSEQVSNNITPPRWYPPVFTSLSDHSFQRKFPKLSLKLLLQFAFTPECQIFPDWHLPISFSCLLETSLPKSKSATQANDRKDSVLPGS